MFKLGKIKACQTYGLMCVIYGGLTGRLVCVIYGCLTDGLGCIVGGHTDGVYYIMIL